MARYKIVLQHFLVVYRAISHLSLVLSWLSHEPLGEKIQVTRGYSIVYHSKALQRCIASYTCRVKSGKISLYNLEVIP